MIKTFGELLDGSHQWYQLVSGEKVNCNEEIINKLWCIWVTSEGAIRSDIEGYTVYEFISPVDMEVLTKEAWLKVYCDYGMES